MSASIINRVQEILERGQAAKDPNLDGAAGARDPAPAFGKSITELAWEYLDEPQVVRELYAVLRRREPKVALEAARVRFLEEELWRRDGKVFRREMYETVEALGDTAARWLPYLIAHCDQPPFALVLGRLGDARAVPALAARLGTASGELLAAVVDALGRLRAVDTVDALISLARSALPTAVSVRIPPRPGDSMAMPQRVGHRRVVANACLALGRIGDVRAMPALVELVTDPAPEMESVVPRAIVALGWLGDAQATHALLPLLEGRHRNVSMYALARISDRSSATHVEAACARASGPPEQTVYPRLMLEALRSRLGRSVDVSIARYALTVVMANRFEATELHETALRMLSVHGAPDELSGLARRFLDAEHPRVRTAAMGALAVSGAVPSPTWLDRPRVDEIYRREGVRGLAGALADPDSVFRHNVIRKAAEEECGREIEGPAIAAARGMVVFPHYSEVTVVDRFESTFDALEALARFHVAAADQFLVSLFDHPSVMVRGMVSEIAKIDIYGASEVLREALRRRAEKRGPPRATLPVTRLGGGPWLFGAPIRAILFDRATTRVAALGDDRIVLFDSDGNELARHSLTKNGASTSRSSPPPRSGGRRTRAAAPMPVAIAFDQRGERISVAFDTGRVRTWDARSGESVGEHQFDAPKTTSLAYGNDGHILLGTATGRLVKCGKRTLWTRQVGAPITRLLAHPDKPQVLVVTGDRIAWFDDRDGGERVSRASRGAVRDLALDEATGKIAALRASGVEVLELDALRTTRRLALTSGARVAFAREGASIVVATTGKNAGVFRFDSEQTSPQRIMRGEIHPPIEALAIDPSTSMLLTGGNGVRIELFDASGHPNSLPIAQHTTTVVATVADAARGRAFSFGADGTVVQWDTEAREIVAEWKFPVGGARAGVRATKRHLSAALGATGRVLLVATERAISAFDLVSGGVRWSRPATPTTALCEGAHTVTVLTHRGLVAVEEVAERLRVLDGATKSGLLSGVDDARIAVASGSKISIVDPRSGETLERLSLGRAKPLLAAGATELGLVVVTSDRSLRRYFGTPLTLVDSVKLKSEPHLLAIDEAASRIALAYGNSIDVRESDLHESGRVVLEHTVTAMAFADGGLLVCGGEGGEVSLVETER